MLSTCPLKEEKAVADVNFPLVQEFGSHMRELRDSEACRQKVVLRKLLMLLREGRMSELARKVHNRLFAGWTNLDTRRAEWVNYLSERALSEPESIEDGFSITVYECICGGYDRVIPAPAFALDQNVSYVLYTDRSDRASADSGWEVRLIPDSLRNLEGRAANRYLKMHPFEFFSSDFSLYLDGNLWLLEDPRKICAFAARSNAGLALFSHGLRDCVQEEARACIALGRGDRRGIEAQVDHARKLGLMEAPGLFEAGLLASDLRNANTRPLYEMWWEEFCEYGSQRDQLALPCALLQCGFTADDIGIVGTDLRGDPRVLLCEHVL